MDTPEGMFLMLSDRGVILSCMASTVAIRLADEDRATLEAAAEAAGQGVSTYVRRIAEAEAIRLRIERIRGETERVVAAIAASPEARAEVELLTGDGEDWPDWTGQLPG